MSPRLLLWDGEPGSDPLLRGSGVVTFQSPERVKDALRVYEERRENSPVRHRLSRGHTDRRVDLAYVFRRNECPRKHLAIRPLVGDSNDATTHLPIVPPISGIEVGAVVKLYCSERRYSVFESSELCIRPDAADAKEAHIEPTGISGTECPPWTLERLQDGLERRYERNEQRSGSQCPIYSPPPWIVAGPNGCSRH